MTSLPKPPLSPAYRVSHPRLVELVLIGVGLWLTAAGLLVQDPLAALTGGACAVAAAWQQLLRIRSDRRWLPVDLAAFRGHPVLIDWLEAHCLAPDYTLAVHVVDGELIATVAVLNEQGHRQVAHGANTILSRQVVRPLKPGLWYRLWRRHERQVAAERRRS